jgi:hypothetical protein
MINETHVLSGGFEGVLVMWRLDQAKQANDFRPRLGAPLVDTVLLKDSSR